MLIKGIGKAVTHFKILHRIGARLFAQDPILDQVKNNRAHILVSRKPSYLKDGGRHRPVTARANIRGNPSSS
jgi:hypothetical protein